jgi:hypothetical protein
MVDKRGKIIGIIGGLFVIGMIVFQNYQNSNNNGGSTNASFYENYSGNNNIKIEKKEKLASIKNLEKEDAIKQSESYKGTINTNKKDKAFSFYRELLKDDSEDKAVETKTDDSEAKNEPDKKEKQSVPKTKVVYVQRPEEPKQTQPAEAPKKEKSFTRTSFYGVNDSNVSSPVSSVEESNSLKCEIYKDQVVSNNQLVKIRVLEDGVINGTFVPRNTFMEGRAEFQNELVQLNVSIIRLDDEFIDVNLYAYSNAGTKGLMAPGSVNQEIAKESATDLIGDARTTLNLPGGLGGISINAGRKKLRQETIPFPNGTPFYLK